MTETEFGENVSGRRDLPPSEDIAIELVMGDELLMNVTGRNFMVEILSIAGDTMRVAFPGIDYPVEGMLVDFELHDPEGFSYFQAVVVQGPRADGDGVVLRLPDLAQRATHRDSARVPTDIDVTLTEEGGATAPGKLRNLSSGGGFIETGAHFAEGSSVAMAVDIPNVGRKNVDIQILHVTEPRATDIGPIYSYGTRFTGYEPGAGRALTQYLWDRLIELYPSV